MNSKDVSDKLDKIEEKLDRVNEKLSNIDVTLVKQASDIEHHIRRTDLAEEYIQKLERKLSPVEKHVSQVSGVLKFFGLLGIAAGIVKAIIEVASYFS